MSSRLSKTEIDDARKLRQLFGCAMKVLCDDPKGSDLKLKSEARAIYFKGCDEYASSGNIQWSLEMARATLEDLEDHFHDQIVAPEQPKVAPAVAAAAAGSKRPNTEEKAADEPVSKEARVSPPLVIAIVGSRTFADYTKLCEVMKGYSPAVIVSGGAQGADTLGARWACEHGVQMHTYKPDWNKHGKAAGFLRNTDIISAANTVIAFWDGKSNGTRDTIDKAKKAGKTVHVVKF